MFGHGEGEGDNRAHQALERALKSPLMDRGSLLEDAHNVLVNIIGGPTMTLQEVQIVMEEINRHIGDHTRLLFGTAVDPRMGQRMTVMLLSALSSEVPARSVVAAPVREREPVLPPVEPVISLVEAEPLPVEPPAPEPIPVSPEAEPLRPAAHALPPGKAPVKSNGEAPKPPREVKQEQLAFEPVTRGRFEKSEPTIVNGEDLDVPAFMRRNVRVK